MVTKEKEMKITTPGIIDMVKLIFKDRMSAWYKSKKVNKKYKRDCCGKFK